MPGTVVFQAGATSAGRYGKSMLGEFQEHQEAVRGKVDRIGVE